MVAIDQSAVASLTKFVQAHPRPDTWPDATKPNPDWDNDCALFCFRYGQWVHGSAFAPVGNVSTAYDAWLGSTKQGDSGHAASAPAWAVHFFEDINGGLGFKAPRPGHVGVGIGGEWMICATVSSSGTAVAGVAHVRKMTVSQYLAEHQDEKYLGWTIDYAKAKYVVIAAPAPVLGPTQRVAVAAGANARTNSSPTSSLVSSAGVKGGQLGTFNGWINGTAPAGSSNRTWFRGVNAYWYWSGGFTDTGTHDLPDLNPVDPPVSPPVDPPADPPVDDPTDPPADPPADDTPPDEPEGPGEADPSDLDDPTDPPVAQPTAPANPGGWIAALVAGVIALVGGILAAIFGTR